MRTDVQQRHDGMATIPPGCGLDEETALHVAHIKTYGFTVVPGVLAAPDIAELRAELEIAQSSIAVDWSRTGRHQPIMPTLSFCCTRLLDAVGFCNRRGGRTIDSLLAIALGGQGELPTPWREIWPGWEGTG